MFLIQFGLMRLFVCLSVSNITQKVMNGVEWNIMAQETSDGILVVVSQITIWLNPPW